MNQLDREKIARDLRHVAVQLLGPGEHSYEAINNALDSAATLHHLSLKAAERVEGGRTGPEFVSIDVLIKEHKLGRSQQVDSVMEKRVRPRLPKRKEVMEAREYFCPDGSDSRSVIINKAKSAMTKAGIPESRRPATLLAMLGGNISYESIEQSHTIAWERSSSAPQLERLIIEPTHPPTFDDEGIKFYISSYLDEFIHCSLSRYAG